ncbi:WbqC family protein [Desulfobulbus sp.]|uniref:WbqC family protein n=1 Tax=Desulfobulbus sp. TaxID=895 RepID=UPI00286FA2C4|nr:WbqC family protein [Desulfobulbus sp.]
MIAGIMQPYFFPYFGYFDHIFRCDTWIVFDLTQYAPKSWMTRNRIQHPKQGWQYINCDVHGSIKMSISTTKLCDRMKTQNKVLGQLDHYKKHAPYYKQVVHIVERAFDTARSDSLTDIDVSGLSAVCDYLAIPFRPIIASEAGFRLPEITHPGQWALEICTLLGAGTYLNTPGGRALFRPEEFAQRGIRLGFTGIPSFAYDCKPYAYEPHLSILDVLMWNSPEEVRAQCGRKPVEYVM